MSKFLFALLVVATLPAFASNICTKSWKDIYKGGVTAEFPKIKMDNVNKNQVGTVFVSVDGLCQAGDKVRTIEPVEVCLEAAKNESGNCIKSERHILSTAIEYIHEIQSSESDKFIGVPSTHPLDYLIPVGYLGEAFTQVCAKEYSIDPCQDQKKK